MTLTNAWIRKYLVSVAEEHGQNLKLSLLTQKKKVQLIEFLSSNVGQKDTVTWATIRDSEVLIPVKFTREAVANFETSGKPFAALLNSLVLIKNFEIIATRIPEPHKQRVTPDLHLGLECNHVEQVGSLDPPQKSLPWIEQDEPISTWISGLRRQGGGGNVLKNRKEEMARRSTSVASPNPETAQIQSYSTPDAIPHPISCRRKPPEIKALERHSTPVAVPRPISYRRMPPEIKALYYKEPQSDKKPLSRRTRQGSHPLLLSSQPDAASPSSSISEPISGWEQTPPRKHTQKESPASASPPTPGQRRRSRYSSPSVLSSQPTARPHVRRVPLPAPVMTLHEEETRILVPASDTSGSQMQSQSIPETQAPMTSSIPESLVPKSQRKSLDKYFVGFKSPSRPMDGYLSCCAVDAIVKGRSRIAADGNI